MEMVQRSRFCGHSEPETVLEIALKAVQSKSLSSHIDPRPTLDSFDDDLLKPGELASVDSLYTDHFVR